MVGSQLRRHKLLTRDKIGKLKFGSSIVNFMADSTQKRLGYSCVR